ncbi:MAG: hypothetical protein HY810_00935 [Candidatus Omnitrophica bacterium]|nr:hypothetical protein [Candidatus Omnitrophota bacterium]
MFKRSVKFIFGIVMLPVCIGVSMALFDLLKMVRDIGRAELFFFGGAVSYTALYLSAFKMNTLYVFGHEAVHAVFALLFGGAVKSFSVSSKGGSVVTTKTNAVISLGPYFFPIHTVFIGVIFFILSLFFENAGRYSHIFFYLAGFSLAFHLLMTVTALKAGQPDLAENGYLFSLTLIYIINIAVMVGMLTLIFKGLSVKEFLINAVEHSKTTVYFLWGLAVCLREKYRQGN